MKKWLSIVLSIVLIAVFGLCALGSGDSESADQGSGSADKGDAIGDYQLEIVSCRLAKTYDNKDAVVVKYNFKNNADKAASFMVTFDDNVFQNGVGLNSAYVLADSAKYSSDNQTKDIQKGASLEVEVAYELNDTTTDIVVEVEEMFSFSDKKITKTFSIK